MGIGARSVEDAVAPARDHPRSTLPEIDPWAPVPFDDLPRPLAQALEAQDWSALDRKSVV